VADRAPMWLIIEFRTRPGYCRRRPDREDPHHWRVLRSGVPAPRLGTRWRERREVTRSRDDRDVEGIRTSGRFTTLRGSDEASPKEVSTSWCATRKNVLKPLDDLESGSHLAGPRMSPRRSPRTTKIRTTGSAGPARVVPGASLRPPSNRGRRGEPVHPPRGPIGACRFE
jgi:hypothetical protein